MNCGGGGTCGTCIVEVRFFVVKFLYWWAVPYFQSLLLCWFSYSFLVRACSARE